MQTVVKQGIPSGLEIVIVVDTNMFLEFGPLSELPWHKVGDGDPIRLIVTSPVLRELDQFKSDHRPNVWRKAMRANKLLRPMVMDGVLVKELRAEAPKIVVELDSRAADFTTLNDFDPTLDDDKIVAICLKLSATSHCDVWFVSHDMGPVLKAKSVGLNAFLVPDSWLPNPKAEEPNATAEHRAEVERLTRSEPRLSVVVSSLNEVGHVRLSKTVYGPVGSDLLKNGLAQLKSRFPIEDDFAKQKEVTARSGVLDAIRHPSPTQRTWHAATENEVRSYERAYEKWTAECSTTIQMLPDVWNEDHAKVIFSVLVKNDGARPADDMLVTFRARGPFLISPADQELEVDSSQDEVGLGRGQIATPPDSPQGKWVNTTDTGSFTRALSSLGSPNSVKSLPIINRTVIPELRRNPE